MCQERGTVVDIVRCTLYAVHCKLDTVQWIQFTVHCTLYNGHSLLYTVHFIQHILFTVCYPLYNVLCTKCNTGPLSQLSVRGFTILHFSEESESHNYKQKAAIKFVTKQLCGIVEVVNHD